MARRSASDWAVLAIEAAGVLVAGLIGAAAGAVLTFTHRQLPPWGLVLAFLLVLMMLVGYRLAFGVRRFAAGAALGIVAATVLLSMPGPGGSVLVADDSLGYIWAIGAPAIAAVVLVVPSRRRGRAEQGDPAEDVADA